METISTIIQYPTEDTTFEALRVFLNKDIEEKMENILAENKKMKNYIIQQNNYLSECQQFVNFTKCKIYITHGYNLDTFQLTNKCNGCNTECIILYCNECYYEQMAKSEIKFCTYCYRMICKECNQMINLCANCI